MPLVLADKPNADGSYSVGGAYDYNQMQTVAGAKVTGAYETDAAKPNADGS
jgi:hypothetical protein